MKRLTIIVPCYNEEAVLPSSLSQLTALLQQLIDQQAVAPTSRLLFVDDGSRDQTWSLIASAQLNNQLVTGLQFSRNFGHQSALLAGLTVASQDADIMITIDADLQDDIQAIPKMIALSTQADVIYGVRDSRKTDTWFKRWSATMFYSLMHGLGVEMVPNAADFRLMSKRAVLALLDLPERNMFLRGMVPLVGFPTQKVFYDRKPRTAGETKYPLRKMIAFAVDGITSFSTVPLRLIMNLGIFVVFIGVVLMIYSLIRKFTGQVVAGWSSLMVSMWVLGGVQLIALSVLGEYVSKVFKEVKRRPRFIIQTDTYSQQKPNETSNSTTA
ncbi:glycosyltransferase family 2 protein [Loigolactobacillus bifermentans]|uniref:Glycosyltransferase n=1 Tax=Loigolactobacillus bifermentans DSM 20003 TaxID=1423726 RepID=A0A0R1GZX4_9LACO|nr:glycosyltransferase family 2 protein [Loigolactobacillus bifermentans]KRK39931.1 glycosyltransferase [Loigolactobacillus bifermentans DSM 20003]QGG61464.1 glycosyltransferase [Loigolactobacillus bifermentans]